jgi:hypothetical protein
MQRNKGYIEIDKELLKELYVNQNKSLKYLCEEVFYVSRPTLEKRIKEYGFKRKQGIKRSHYKHIDMDVLKKLYYEKGYALYDIAGIFKCSLGLIVNRMKEHNLERRKPWSRLKNDV